MSYIYQILKFMLIVTIIKYKRLSESGITLVKINLGTSEI